MSGSNGGKTPKIDILDLLREAEEQNNADMNVEAKKHKPEMDKTKVVSGSEPKKKTKVTKRINAETAELIDKYSTHKDTIAGGAEEVKVLEALRGYCL